MPEPQAFIGHLKVIDLPELNLGRSDIVVFVGPNNGGKTFCLDTIYQIASGQGSHPEITATLAIQGSVDELWRRLADSPGATIEGERLQGPGWTIDKGTLHSIWRGAILAPNPHQNLNFLKQLFVRVPLESRATITGPKIFETPADDNSHNNHNNPIAMMARQPKVLKKVSAAFKDAFGLGIFLNTGRDAPNYPIHLGDKPDLGEFEPVADVSQEKFRQFPLLSQQGSGMQAFAKIVLATLSREAFLTFIDEPETFLHPPQAYVLGKFIAENQSDDRQLFLATHSSELLKGLLEGASDRLRIIRVTRKNSKSHAATLETKSLNELWSDLFLQYSNVLAGLFHDSVIGCEGEQDCRYFAGIYSAMTKKKMIATRKDLLFVSCGGKGVLKKVLRPLRAFGVSSVVVVDFDIIENAGELQKLAEAADCPWDSIEQDAATVREYFNKLENRLKAEVAFAALEEFKKRIGADQYVGQKAIDELRKVIRANDGWSIAKEKGIGQLEGSPTLEVAQRLLARLGQYGIQVIRQGTLESLNPEKPGKSAERIEELLRLDVTVAPEFDNARSLVRGFTGFELSGVPGGRVDLPAGPK